jgi:hypothetical protein
VRQLNQTEGFDAINGRHRGRGGAPPTDPETIFDRPHRRVHFVQWCLGAWVLGFTIYLEKPSAFTAGLAIAHAVLPKEDWLAGVGVHADWPCWGKMRTHCDNAKEFRGTVIGRACQDHAIAVEHRHRERRGTGTYPTRIRNLVNSRSPAQIIWPKPLPVAFNVHPRYRCAFQIKIHRSEQVNGQQVVASSCSLALPDSRSEQR